MELVRPIRDYAKKFRNCFNCNHPIRSINIGNSKLMSNGTIIPTTLIDRFTFPSTIEISFECSECSKNLCFLFQDTKLKQVIVAYSNKRVFYIKNSNSIEKEIYFGDTSVEKNIKDLYNFDYKKMLETITIYY